MSLSPAGIRVHIVGSLPSWRPASGLLADITLAPLRDQMPRTVLDAQFFFDEEFHVDISAWSTGVYTPYVGNWGAYLFGGGGHNTYYGNERYVFTLDDRVWKRYGPWGPGDPATDIYATGEPPLGGSLHEVNFAYNRSHNAAGGTTPPFIWNAAEDGYDGNLADDQPLPPHEYDTAVFLPPSFGGVGSAGSCCWLNQPYACGTANGIIARKWDIAAGLAGPVRIAATNKWTRAALNRAGIDTPTSCVDEAAKHVYAMKASQDIVVLDFISRYDFSAGTGLATVTDIPLPGHNSNARYPTGAFYAGPNGGQRFMMQFGGATFGVTYGPASVRLYDLSRLGLDNPPFTELVLSGAPDIGYAPAVCYCPDINTSNGGVFFVYANTTATDDKIYKVTPPARPGTMSYATWLGEPWVWQEYPFVDANGNRFNPEQPRGLNIGPFAGAWKRMQYASAARCIIFESGPSRVETLGKMYAYTPQDL
jgi:hypothetical protein